jgi:hypothetical protein
MELEQILTMCSANNQILRRCDACSVGESCSVPGRGFVTCGRRDFGGRAVGSSEINFAGLGVGRGRAGSCARR